MSQEASGSSRSIDEEVIEIDCSSAAGSQRDCSIKLDDHWDADQLLASSEEQNDEDLCHARWSPCYAPHAPCDLPSSSQIVSLDVTGVDFPPIEGALDAGSDWADRFRQFTTRDFILLHRAM